MSVSTLSAFRLATPDDAPGIGAFQARAWRDTCANVLPSKVIDDFSVEARIAAWRQILRRPSFQDNAFVLLTSDARGITALGAANAGGVNAKNGSIDRPVGRPPAKG